MISDNALSHFDQIWSLFDTHMLNLKGSMFLVEPFEIYLNQKFSDNLKENESRFYLLNQLQKWGNITLDVSLKDQIKTAQIPDGPELVYERIVHPDKKWATYFILNTFYNLCCLIVHKQSIEELIFIASHPDNTEQGYSNSQKAFLKLVGISNCFIMAEWSKNIFARAISNSDQKFFNILARRLKENEPEKRYTTARAWLGTILLWYLGGKNLKRIELMNILIRKDILSKHIEERSFNSSLFKMGLITHLDNAQ